ncbi:hypothetical protein [Peribacillus kribbensis]|uniref:hypothetical protein n=1 Tax=Peribacillus kribbensis TaxID=356658 RepID=UPI00040C24A2|nr:hypothetical protein [Peribacillus kribbensis]
MDVLKVGELLLEVLDRDDAEAAEAVQKGFALHSRGLVYRLADFGEEITATVQDEGTKKVYLDCIMPQESSCSCNWGFMCQHQIAVFLTAYARKASAISWLSSWKGTSKSPAEELSNVIPITSAKELLKQKTSMSRDYSTWKKFTKSSFKSYILENKTMPEYMLDRMLSSFNQRIREKAPLEREWRHLYDFITNYIVFLECLKLLNAESSPKVSLSFFHDLAADLAEELQDMVLSIGRQSQPFAFDKMLAGIKDEAEQLLSGRNPLQFERLELYRSLWRHLFNSKDWRTAEWDRLQSELDEPHSEIEKLSLQVAAIHLSLLLSKDEEARSLIDGLPPSASPFLYSWLQRAIETGNEKRTLFFVEHVINRIGAYLGALHSYYERSDFVRTFAMPIRVFCQETKKSDLLERFYKETLPYSFLEYARMLLEQKEYRRWVELQVISGDGLSMVSNETIKILQKEEPSLLLPLYHHVVFTSLEQKNRPAYKTAVRYLKKLKTLYKKLDQEERWAYFLNHLTVSTKRLRAFQEELQRGKLIHVE